MTATTTLTAPTTRPATRPSAPAKQLWKTAPSPAASQRRQRSPWPPTAQALDVPIEVGGKAIPLLGFAQTDDRRRDHRHGARHGAGAPRRSPPTHVRRDDRRAHAVVDRPRRAGRRADRDPVHARAHARRGRRDRHSVARVPSLRLTARRPPEFREHLPSPAVRRQHPKGSSP